MLIPGLSGEEFDFLQEALGDLPDEQLETFASVYNSKRRNPDHILVGGVIGFLGVAGVQRFMINQIGMGILYLFTAGLCFIGTIVDLINYKSLAFEYNRQMAMEARHMTESIHS